MIADESDMSAALCSWFSGDDRIVSKRNEMFQFPNRVHIALPVWLTSWAKLSRLDEGPGRGVLTVSTEVLKRKQDLLEEGRRVTMWKMFVTMGQKRFSLFSHRAIPLVVVALITWHLTNRYLSSTGTGTPSPSDVKMNETHFPDLWQLTA